MVAHGSGRDEFLGRLGADAPKRRSDLKFRADLGSGLGGGLVFAFGFTGATTTTGTAAAGAAVINFSGGGRAVTIIRKMLREGDAVFPLGQGAKPRSEAVDAGGGGAQAEQETRARRIADRGLAVGVQKRRPAGREAIKMGRLGHGVAAEVPDPVVLVVDGDEEDVGFFHRRRGGGESE